MDNNLKFYFIIGTTKQALMIMKGQLNMKRQHNSSGLSVMLLAIMGATFVILNSASAARLPSRPSMGERKANGVLALHPANPRYFLWRGKPTLLIGSGEHYGAVLNRQFDYVKYLDTLKRSRLNHTRLFTGLYVEDNGQLRDGPQAGNTLDPAPGQLLCPFARSDTPGYPKGGNKFDLKRWDEAFFTRLKDFVAKAAQRGVIVEVTLFSPYYDDRFNQWKLSPLNAANNVNEIGRCKLNEVFTLDRHDGLLAVQEAMVRRIVKELRDFDNVYYEICNEPYSGATLEWQRHIAEVIVAAEKDFPHKHLIAQNVEGGQNKPETAHPAVSILNFHYATADVATRNYGLNKPLGDDETGFKGTTDAPYRREAWEFLLAGGTVFSHLDYSFTVGHEDGSFVVPAGQWGGGSPSLRKQLQVLKDFMHGFDFVRMAPDNTVVKGGVPEGMRARGLSEPGKAYAVYVGPTGEYSARWMARLDPPRSESYTFYTVSEGGVRLWVNGIKLIDNSVPHVEAEDSGTIDLVAGQKVEIRMEYWKGSGVGSAKLFWSSPSRKKEVVPSEFLSPIDGGGKGFKAEYFAGKEFARHKLTRTDAVVDFYWGSSSPLPAEEAPFHLAVNLPAGAYHAAWVNTLTGKVDKEERFRHQGGTHTLLSPPHAEDIALRLKHRASKADGPERLFSSLRGSRLMSNVFLNVDNDEFNRARCSKDGGKPLVDLNIDDLTVRIVGLNYCTVPDGGNKRAPLRSCLGSLARGLPDLTSQIRFITAVEG